MTGTTVSFNAGDKNFSQLWEGTFGSENKLEMSWFFLEGENIEPVTTRVFRRSSPSEVASLKAGLPKDVIFRKLPLPKLRDLPPNGLAQTPPMGWSSWNRFMESINEDQIRAAADALVSSGLRDAGYTLVEVDDGWQGERDTHGSLHSNSKFGDMKALSNYIHSRVLNSESIQHLAR